jgi:putative iron-only hydrogenase system regulator
MAHKAFFRICPCLVRGFLCLMEGIVSLEKRLGFIGIIVENRNEHAAEVNDLLSKYGDLIIARTGVPYSRRGCAVISLVVDATTDEVGELSGKLGSIPDVSVKSMLVRKRQLTEGEYAAPENKH